MTISHLNASRMVVQFGECLLCGSGFLHARKMLKNWELIRTVVWIVCDVILISLWGHGWFNDQNLWWILERYMRRRALYIYLIIDLDVIYCGWCLRIDEQRDMQ